jgi:hypothetical protein
MQYDECEQLRDAASIETSGKYIFSKLENNLAHFLQIYVGLFTP